MLPIASLLSLNPRAIVAIGLAVLVAAVLGWSRWQVHGLRADLAEAKAETLQLAAQVGVQNAQVSAWKQAAAQRQAAASAALDQASSQRQRADRLAATIRATPLPKEECDALRAIVDTARTGGL